MAEAKKVISKDTKLRAFALFTMAASHYEKCQEFERALHETLGYPADDNYMGCLSDEIYDGAAGKFEVGFRKEGFTTKPNGKKRA